MTVHRSSVTSVSWIPSGAIPNVLVKVPILMGIGHYDPPPPDRLEDLDGLHEEGRFRFANRLRARVETEGGEIVDAAYEGGGLISKTVADFRLAAVGIPPVRYPDIQREPEYGDGWVRFIQTTGGRTGAPMPRKTSRPPYLRVTAPVVWTTLALTIHADGRSVHQIVGASPFPRHWFYDHDGRLVEKSGIADYSEWADSVVEERSPWADAEHELIVAKAETELERVMSAKIMQHGRRPEMRGLQAGETLTEQGEEATELYLVLDGILSVEVDGEPIAEAGPGAVLGERALLEGGRRTASLRAVTPVRLAVAERDRIEPAALRELAELHRREDHRDVEAGDE